MNDLPFKALHQNQRRKFLKQLCAASLTAFTVPAIAAPRSFLDPRCNLPPYPREEDEEYWEAVKKQFAVPQNLMMVNAANLCPSPSFISEEVATLTKSLGRDVSFQYRATLNEKRNKALTMLADFLSITKSEIAITRNTSESNAIVVNSLGLKQGDEVVIWDQNHPSAGIAFELRAKRYGFATKKVSVPPDPKSPDELIEHFANAISAKTRLLAFSHISNISGIALPIRQICQLARGKKVLTLVDGAQSFGLMEMNLKETGCDFYTGSTHKWLMGPLENGILYVNQEQLERIVPNIIGGGWREDGNTLDEKTCVLGQRNDATSASIPAIIEFHHKVGKNNIESRVMQLNTYLKKQIETHIPHATFVTPMSTLMSAGIVIINLPGKNPAEIYQKLYDEHGIACAATGGIRFSPHIYNTLADLDKIVGALKLLSA